MVPHTGCRAPNWFPLVLLLFIGLISRGADAFDHPAGYPADGTFRIRSMRPAADAALLLQMSVDPAAAAGALRRSVELQTRRQAVRPSEEFLVFNFTTRRYESRSAVLRTSGKYCHIYVSRDSAGLLGDDSEALLAQIRDIFDDRIYPLMTSWFGEVALPAELGLPDEKIYIHLCDIHDELESGYIAGYFDSRDLESSTFPTGNLKPVFHMDLNPGKPGDPGDKYNLFYRTLAHEFQHMINFMRHKALNADSEERWLEEGLSGFAEYVYTAALDKEGVGLPPDPHLSRFLENPDIVLTLSDENEWFADATLFRHYGASFLFVYYLQEKFGHTPEAARSFIRSLISNGSSGISGVNSTLARQHPPATFEETIRHWLIANHLNRPDLQNGFWGYIDKACKLGEEARGLPIAGALHQYIPGGDTFVGGEGRVRANSAHYEMITGTGRVTMRFDADSAALTPLLVVPAEPGSERWMNLPLNGSGSAEIELDFASTPKYVLAVAAATASADAGPNPIGYRFSLAPARVVLYPIPHPAFAGEFIVVVASRDGTALATPTVTVKFNNLETTVQMCSTDPASKTVFVGSYAVPGTGEGQVSATLPGGNRSSFSFFNAVARAGISSRLALHGAELTISARTDGAGASLFESSIDGFPSGLNILSRPYLVVLPETGTAEARLLIETAARGAANDRCIGLWSADGKSGRWSRVSRSEKGLFSDIRHGGVYLLASDEVRPQIHDYRMDETTGSPVLAARLSDDGSGIDADSVRVEAAGVVVPHSFDGTTGLLTADLTRASMGRQKITLEAADLAGNTIQAALVGTLAGPLRIIQTIAWPNPARGPVTLAVMLAGDGSDDPLLEGEAVICDISGHDVAVLQLSGTGKHTLSSRWDGRNAAGTSVANGVYLFRVRITRNGEHLKATGKIAILH